MSRILVVQLDDAVHLYTPEQADTADTVAAVGTAAGYEADVYPMTVERWEQQRAAVEAAGGTVHDHRRGADPE